MTLIPTKMTTNVTIGQVRRRIPLRSRHQGSVLPPEVAEVNDYLPNMMVDSDFDSEDVDNRSMHDHPQGLLFGSYAPSVGVYSARRTSAARGTDDSISDGIPFSATTVDLLYVTATQSKHVEDISSWVLDSMTNVSVACNPDLVVHLRATAFQASSG